MKKILSLLVVAILSTTAAMAQTVLANYDFNDNNKDGLLIYDLDKSTPSVFMQRIGFAVDKTWIILQDAATSTDKFLGSTSQYTPAGKANDWLILPNIHVTGKGFVLEWKSQSFQSSLRDGIKIFISTTGNTPDEFPATPVWEIEEEEAGATENFENEFAQHSISLDEYVGQTIHIAFVNQSNNKSILAVDDIKVSRDDAFGLDINTDRIIYEVEDIAIEGYIKNYTTSNIEEVEVTLTYGDNVITETITGLNIAKGQSAPFAMEHRIATPYNKTIEYTLEATTNNETFSYTSQITNTFNRRVVIEDHTGLWCGNCPGGMWAIDSIKATYPNNIAAISVQNNNGAPSDIVVDSYDGGLSSAGLMAFPSGWIDRTYIENPFGNGQYDFEDKNSWISLFKKQLALLPQAGVAVTGYLLEDNSIHAKAVVRTAETKSNLDWRVIFVLVEDNVEGYYQKNDLTGKASWLGGWESLPGSVPITLNDLARGIYPSFYGEKGSLPATITVGANVSYTHNITIPTVVKDINNLHLIAMVVDGTTSQVVNANMVHVEKAPEAIEGVEQNNLAAHVWVDENCIKVAAEQGANLTASLIAIDGRLLASASGTGNITIETGNYRGIALVQVASEGSICVKKVVIK